MSFVDRAKDLLDRHDDEVDQAQQRTGAGDATLPDTGPGIADGGPAEEQQLEPQDDLGSGDQGSGDQGGAVERAPEVPGGPGPDVPAGPGHVPPQR